MERVCLLLRVCQVENWLEGERERESSVSLVSSRRQRHRLAPLDHPFVFFDYNSVLYSSNITTQLTQLQHPAMPPVYGGAPKSVHSTLSHSSQPHPSTPCSPSPRRLPTHALARTRRCPTCGKAVYFAEQVIGPQGSVRYSTLLSLPHSCRLPRNERRADTPPTRTDTDGRCAQYHKACLKCVACGKSLEPRLLLDHDGQVSPPPFGSLARCCS